VCTTPRGVHTTAPAGETPGQYARSVRGR
jgi:hypothetical protein